MYRISVDESQRDSTRWALHDAVNCVYYARLESSAASLAARLADIDEISRPECVFLETADSSEWNARRPPYKRAS